MFIWFPPNFFPLLLPHTKLVRDSEEELLVEKRRGPCCYTLKLGKLSTFKFIPKNRKRDNKLSAQLIIRNSIFAHPSLPFNLKNNTTCVLILSVNSLHVVCSQQYDWYILSRSRGSFKSSREVCHIITYIVWLQVSIWLCLGDQASHYNILPSFWAIVTLSNVN